MPTCATCGHPLDDHDKHVRFRLPEPVLRIDKELGEPLDGDRWLSDPDPAKAVMLQDQRVGPFVRALLPVKLTGGYSVTYGVWVGIHPDDLQESARVWSGPEYVDLRISGFLGNVIEPWDVFAAPVQLAVLDPDHTPYCVSSEHPALRELLTREWDHQTVLGADGTAMPPPQ
ncbi:DUF2199 domain-containing protein [Nocardioides sp. NPDC057772]|uniref:DUF2199 domain-containing protein n=1 Tax=Nocardioides sp. NPDC057772 TaxID=3346245 RepID=UPI00366BA23D